MIFISHAREGRGNLEFLHSSHLFEPLKMLHYSVIQISNCTFGSSHILGSIIITIGFLESFLD